MPLACGPLTAASPRAASVRAVRRSDWHAWWERRGAEELRELLLVVWDPIGVRDTPGAQDEYDPYAERLAHLLRDGATEEELGAALAEARAHMGLPPSRYDRFAAEHLLAWHRRSTADPPPRPTLQWDGGESSVVEDGERLDRLLDELAERHRDAPIRASLRIGTGATLGIGLGREQTVLDYVGPAPEWPPYYVSVGDELAPDDHVDFHWLGQHTPCSRRDVVPNDLGRDALRRFLERGELSREVRWREV